MSAPSQSKLLSCYVTGAASGIGNRVADLLLSLGHQVSASDVNTAALSQKGAHWPKERVRLETHDVRSADAWDACLDRHVAAFGRIDVLMNIAGYMGPGYLHATPAVEVDKHFDINAKGVIFGIRAAAQRMIPQGSGHIINIASMAALAPVPGLSLYSASKYAVRAASLAAAWELREKGIYVTVVCPDPVDSAMIVPQREHEEAALSYSAPRILSVQEVAECLTGSVLRKRPLEVILPRRRGWLAKSANMFPELGHGLAPLLTRYGRKRQAQAQKQARGDT